MYYVGLDVHSRQSTFCVLDDHGAKVLSRTVHGRWDKVVHELGKIKRPFTVCFEASTGYGPLHDGLRRVADRVVMAHPGHLRLIFGSKRKSDRVDAAKLALLLYAGVIQPVHVPCSQVRGWRRLIEHRRALVAERTRVKNRTRALLRSVGVRPPKGLWSASGIAWLRALAFTEPGDALGRDLWVERLASLDRMIRRVEDELDRIGGSHPGVTLLRTIPGVGQRTAEAVMAAIDQPKRFGKNKAIGTYFGLVPCQDASAHVNRLGHITKDGPDTARGLLVEAAWQGVRHSARIRARFERVCKGDPARRKIAIVATAHYLSRVILAMLQTGETWHDEAA